MACPLLLFWCPPPATSSTVLLGTVALSHHPATLCWWGWQSWSSPSMTPLLSHDFFFWYFQACFSHSHWLSQLRWHEQTSLQGPFPHAPGGVWDPHMGKDGWDWRPCGLLSYGLTPSQGNVKVMNWEEPVVATVLIYSLSSWHKLHHYSQGFYISDLENPKLFYSHPRFMFCSLAGSELFLWWSRWFTLSSPLLYLGS